MSEEYRVKDITLASEGQKKIDWVSRPMKVLNGLSEKFLKDGTFRGKKISICMHLEAKMDGFQVMPLEKACPLGDFFITSTGEPNIIRKEHFLLLKEGAFLANAGHFDYEINVDALKQMTKAVKEVREEVQE